MALNARFWSNLYVTQLRSKVAPGTFESRKVGAASRCRAQDAGVLPTCFGASTDLPPSCAPGPRPTCPWRTLRLR
jgi:hypothetical protein